MTIWRGPWLRAIVVAVGTVEVVILVGILASWIHDASLAPYVVATPDLVRAVRFAVHIFIVQLGPSVICVIAGLVLGVMNRWLWVALALLIAAPSLPFAVVALFGSVDV